MSKILCGAILFLFSSRLSTAAKPPVELVDFASKRHEVRWDASNLSGTVFIFMSSVCPCSLSHEEKIKSLIHRYPRFRFFGVHSNQEEDPEYAKTHFEKSAIPFVVFASDRDQKLANRFGALKTPHAFVFDRSGQPLYRGAVDNSHNAGKASKEHLENALNDIAAGRSVKLSETKPLGCVIGR